MMMPEPQSEHRWFDKLHGDWTYEATADMGPDQPEAKTSGTEHVRSLGGFWMVAEGQGSMPGGGKATTIMTLGFDPKSKRYTGTWVGSMMGHLWLYDGEMDATGRILTLNSEGPAMSEKGGLANYQDIIEIVSDDHRVMRAQVQREDGTWNHFMTVHYRRKKS